MKLVIMAAAVVLTACVVALVCSRLMRETGVPAVAIDASSLPSGMVAYRQGEGILVKPLDVNAKPLRISENGSFPRFSPDGAYVAFVGSNCIMLANTDGSGLKTLTGVEKGRAVAFHPDGREVLFTDGDSVKAVTISNGVVRTVASGYTFREVDVSPDGAQMVATVRNMGVSIRIFDMVNGGSRRLSAGCSASFSPDGKLITRNSSDHRRLNFLEQTTGRIVGGVSSPPGMKFDNQFWSNHSDWLVSLSEGVSADVYVHHATSNLYCRVTDGGNCDRPDLFIRTGNKP